MRCWINFSLLEVGFRFLIWISALFSCTNNKIPLCLDDEFRWEAFLYYRLAMRILHRPNTSPCRTPITLTAKFIGPTWGQIGSCRPQLGPMLFPWTLLSGYTCTTVWSVLGSSTLKQLLCACVCARACACAFGLACTCARVYVCVCLCVCACV